MSLLEIKKLEMDFGMGADALRAVDGVSLTIGAGETVCLVGESGCGKSVTALSIAQLVPTPIHPPPGCPFHPRCPVAQLPRCKDEFPGSREIQKKHWASCHFAGTKIEQSNRADNRNA
jgi:ABC-type dipeptide/oligopeptide/nickel transport system ATPase component